MTVLILRFDAPLVSFGGPAIDHHGVVQTFPALSMLTGLIANALGWRHADMDRLEALQERIRYAARIDCPGEPLLDYQTVDLGHPWMIAEQAGWTTRGRLQIRTGANSTETHQRKRHYRADSVCTVALTLTGESAPTTADVAAALNEPARPLFIGRKCCLPAAPILMRGVEAASLVMALAEVPRTSRSAAGPLRAAWYDTEDAQGSDGLSHVVPVSDERDWHNGVHVGRRLMRHGWVNPPEASHG